MNEEVAGLFGNEASSTSEESEDTIPEDWKLLNNMSDMGEERIVHNSVGVNMFYPKSSDSLETGQGRDDLTRTVLKHVQGDYDINGWRDYEAEDVVGLNVYLLDRLDEKGSLRGKDVVGYLEEFVRQDGEPDYLQEFDY